MGRQTITILRCDVEDCPERHQGEPWLPEGWHEVQLTRAQDVIRTGMLCPVHSQVVLDVIPERGRG